MGIPAFSARLSAALDDVLTSKISALKMPAMRTTLTIDDDLAGLLKQRAREMGVPFKEAVNRAIRAGLGEAAARTRRGAAPKTIAHSFGFRPGIDLDKLGQLADELEAEAFAPTVEKSRAPARRQRSRSRA
jgi:Arc/MetJ family transcription regulator